MPSRSSGSGFKGKPKVDETRPPFPPSWINRLHGAIDRLPGSPWIAYTAATVLLVLLAIWSDQFVDPSSLTQPTAYGAVITLFPLALIHYLDGVARSCLQSFRPALSYSDTEVERLSYELTTMPRGAARWVSLLGVGFAILGLLVSPEEMLGPPGMPNALSIVGFAGVLFGYMTFGLLFYHTIRQLRLVSRIHSRAASVNLFQPQPLYAFSTLTLRTAVALVLLSYYIVAVSSGGPMGPATIGLLGINLSLSVVLFTLPLYGLHIRLREEKNRLMSAVSGRIEAVLSSLHRALEEPAAGQVDTLNKGLASLMVERDLIVKSPTWPWTPGTVRAFASSALLPIALWLITRVLESSLGR
jgi:hypothetical protein